jgi:glutathione S-transferase
MLEHDGFWLSESAAIVEYVDEVFEGPKVMPTNMRERARARQVMQWIRTDLAALRSERPTQSIFFPKAFPGPLPSLSSDGEVAAQKLLRGARNLLSKAFGPEQLFATWSVADADLALMLMRLIANGHEIPAPLVTYANAQWHRPSVAEFVLRRRPPVPYYL